MPTVMQHPHPMFHVHDRHPALHSLPVVLLSLAFVVAFILSVMPGVVDLLNPPAPQAQASTVAP
jgi:hypothetical protein